MCTLLCTPLIIIHTVTASESLNRYRNPATARGGVEGCRCGVGENSPDISKFYVPKKGETLPGVRMQKGV